MGRKLEIEPRWLVSMLTAWVRYGLAQIGSGLGYPRQTPYLSSIKSRQSSYDGVSLNAYDKEDFDQIEPVMRELALTRPELFAAVTMYYKPWTVDSFKVQGYPFGNTTYYDRLKCAHKWMAKRLEAVEKRIYSKGELALT